MYRLQPKFYPHRFDLIEFTQKLQNILSQAVRPCSDRHCHHRRMPDRFCKNSSEIFYRCIGIGICLEICDIFMDRTLRRQDCDLTVNLFGDRQGRICGEIAASTLTAENTASVSQLSVTVRTGHPSVQCHLVYLLAKSLSQHIVQ